MLKNSKFENLKYYGPKKIEFYKPYNSETEHVRHHKLYMFSQHVLKFKNFLFLRILNF